jgi:hypothetical protein
MKVIEGLIYKAKRGHVYDQEKKQFDCYAPCYTGDFGLVDCWVCDEEGNIHAGYNVSPVPVSPDVLGKVVGKMGAEYDECVEY